MSSDIIKQFQEDKDALLKRFGGDWQKVVEAIAAASKPADKTNENVLEGVDAIQAALADADIDSKIVGKNIQVPNESLGKAKGIVKKLDPDLTVVGGLHESIVLKGLQSFKEFFKEAAGCSDDDEEDKDGKKKSDSDKGDDDQDGKKSKEEIDEKKAK